MPVDRNDIKTFDRTNAAKRGPQCARWLLCEEVVTETRRASSHVATRWHLASRHRAPWKWVHPVPGLVASHGTAIRLKLRNALSPLLDAGFIEAALRRNYEPLLDTAFDTILTPLYKHEIEFVVNGRRLERRAAQEAEQARLEIRLGRKRKASALAVMVRDVKGLPEDRRSIAISTYGKVIKRGWDWLGVSPMTPALIGGTIEAPELAGCLTLNKGDFIRSGPRGAVYIAYRRAIQTIVSEQLAVWGDTREPAEQSQRRAARPIERDLENVLVDLADDFPLLASLVEHRLGGQRKLPIGRSAGVADARALIASSVAAGSTGSNGDSPGGAGPADRAAQEMAATSSDSDSGNNKGDARSDLQLPASSGPRRPARYGLTIQFETRNDDPELARLVESNVWINEAHPAYHRAVSSRSEGYHLALSVAMALAPLAVQSTEEHAFITAFLARWGEALERADARRKMR